MGRLIDADKLKEVMSAAKDEYGNVAESFFNMGGELSTEWWCVEDMVDNAETVEAIPLDWIRTYISNLKAMGVQLSLRDAQAVSVMVDKYMMEQYGNATCGPDYCDINFGGGTKA